MDRGPNAQRESDNAGENKTDCASSRRVRNERWCRGAGGGAGCEELKGEQQADVHERVRHCFDGLRRWCRRIVW